MVFDSAVTPDSVPVAISAAQFDSPFKTPVIGSSKHRVVRKFNNPIDDGLSGNIMA